MFVTRLLSIKLFATTVLTSAANDRRSYALVATEQGNNELRGLSQRLKAYELAISANLTAEERVQIMALLAKVAV